MKHLLALLVFAGALFSTAPARAQSPADGARFPSNATVEFDSGDQLGEEFRLRVARDLLFTDIVFERVDAYDLGQWFVEPRKRGMAPGTYFWQVCWRDYDTGEDRCSQGRKLVVTAPRVPTLALSGAKAVVRDVFADRDSSWSIWSGKRYGCRRSSRIRVLCRPTGWAGDTVMTATLRMVNRLDGRTRVRGWIEYFSEYCADVTPERDCTDRHRVAGVY